MDSIFENDKINDLLQMLSATRKQKNLLQDEIESCQDCIDDIKEELIKRGAY